MKENLIAIAALYPDREEVWETSDGLLHLTSEAAEAQAKHLPDTKVKIHKLKKSK